ncbi:MAG: carbohydrate ABC transporter permease [Oscillospiraceae bacterium]|nr:carbohydrate ABC transporter permease [Oscillospiraceae bacterium]
MTGSKKKKTARIVLFIAALLLAAAFILPMLLTVVSSFMTQSELTSNYGEVFDSRREMSEGVNLKLIPDKVTFSQYGTVLLRSPDYLYKFWNSVILVVPIVVFQIAVALLAAYGFTRWRGRLRELVFFIYILLMLMPYQVTLVPNYLVSDWLGILKTRWAIWLPAIASPFAVFLLTKYMRRIPKSYTEAAELDGASRWVIFKTIYVPLCRGIILSVAILLFIDYWNMVEQPLVLLNAIEKFPLSVYLAEINSGEYGVAFAVAVIYMIPPMLLFLYGEDDFVQGITYTGGLKD